MSSTVLSLLVALVSVVGFTVPIIKDAIVPKNSHLVLMGRPTFSSDFSSLIVVISNTGNRAGRFDGLTAEARSEAGSNSRSALFVTKESGIVMPGESKEFNLTKREKYVDWLTPENSDGQNDWICRYQIDFVDFRGTFSQIEDRAPCGLLNKFLNQ